MSFVEMRTYQLHTGVIADFVAVYRELGYEAQTRHLGRPVGWYTADIGGLNQVVHLWRYESLDDRAARRAAMLADPDFRRYLEIVTPMILTQESKLLLDVHFD